MTNDLSKVIEFDTLYNEAYTCWNPFYPLAERDLRFYLGDQWDEQEKRKLFSEGRSTFTFNRLKPAINFLTGYQRQHRQSSVVMPIEDADQLVADQMTKVIFHVMQNSDGYRYISDAFSGAVKTGWNLINLYLDFSSDPINGDIRFNRLPYNGFICDPYFSKLDFSDCSYILERKYMDVESCAALLPEMKKEIYRLNKYGWERDDKFTWLPYQRMANGQDLMAYNEMYQVKWKNVDIIVDQETGEYRKWPGTVSQLDEYIAMFPQFTKSILAEKFCEKNIIINNQFMKTEINKYGINDYPHTPFIYIFEPESDQWELKVQSFTRQGIDPQRETNRRRSQMTDMIDSQLNSGWIAEEDSVINPKSLFQTGQGKVIWKKSGLAPEVITKIPPAQIPPSSFQLQELYDKDINYILGINEAAFGQVNSANESGIMQMIRQGASIANLQEVLDNLRFAQCNITKKIVKIAQTWTPQKLSRILNEEVDPKFFDPDLSKYDISIQEGLLTETQRQMYFRQLVELQQLGAPVSPSMLAKAAPIQGKSEYNRQIEENEKQQAQAQQQQQQIENQKLQAQEHMAQAKAISDIALSKERFTRSIANLGLEDERASKAIQDRSDAALSRVKAMKELESMDDERLFKYFNFIQTMEESNRQKEEQIKEDDIDISKRANQPQEAPNMGQNPQLMGLMQNMENSNGQNGL